MFTVHNKYPFSDDNIWCHSSQRLLLPELFQHLRSFGGQCIAPLNGHGVSAVQYIPYMYLPMKSPLVKSCNI